MQYQERLCSTKIVTLQYQVRVFSMRSRCAVQDIYITVQHDGVQYEEKVCSTKIVTSQYEVRTFSMRRRCAVPR